MHVFQLFQQLFLRINIEVIITRLPYRASQVNSVDILADSTPQKLIDLERAALFPMLHEDAQYARPGKPQKGMDMIRHDHKTETSAFQLSELACKVAEDDSFGSIMIQQTPPSKA